MIEISKGEDDNDTVTAAGFMGSSNNFTSLMKYTQPTPEMKKGFENDAPGSVDEPNTEVTIVDSMSLQQIENLLRNREQEIEQLKAFIENS
jgi:hypothetical protein